MTDPIISGYMGRFETALRSYRLKECSEITADVRNHIYEAMGVGKPANTVLDSLGPAEMLARAYAVELAIPCRHATVLRMAGSPVNRRSCAPD